LNEMASESPLGGIPQPAAGERPGPPVSHALSRRAMLRALAAGGGAALLAACQQAPAAPARPAAGSAPAAPATTAPASSSGAAGPAGWEREWEALIAAARQEGRLVFGGPPSADVRLALPAKFKERFGIEMEYLAFPPNQGEFIERIARERAAGLVTVDAFIGGAQSIFTAAYPQQIMAPIRPVLMHPEALDVTKWRPGRIWFKDPEDTYFMQIFNQVGGQIGVNTDFVRPDEIKGYRDLLKPAFTGKISVWNPTLPGTGWNTANWLRITFGDDFFKQLYVDQKPGIPEDARQWGDWLARGSYPVALGVSARDVEVLKKDGFKVEVLPSDPEAPGVATGAFGIVVLIDQAPHPNAAKLFVNWMAMREGQETWGRADQIPVVRTDLDNSWAPAYTVPRSDLQYMDGYDWNYVNTAFPESIPKIRQIMALRG
jgi:ABC-type Fe3+ transport system substrate-binding protein